MNPFADFIARQARLLREGKQLPLGPFPAPTRPAAAPDAPTVLIFSPHPDDECVVGGLPLRLQAEKGWRVVNVAVTQGSKRARQAERLAELQGACAYLGFGLQTMGERGLEDVSPRSRADDPRAWATKARAVADILVRHQPRMILFPHERDWNKTHIGVHWLLRDALAMAGPGFTTLLLETEFWGQQHEPNLLVEIPESTLAELVTALTFHVGEVHRNPYHLTLPAWMTNSVRLGGETVGGQGAAPPDFLFGTVYRLRRWVDGGIAEVFEGGRIVRATDDPAALLA